MKRKKLGKMIICGVPYQVTLGNADNFLHDIANRWGETDHVEMQININSKPSLEMKEDTLLHECLHAILQQSGAKDMMLRAGINDINSFEETLIRIITPHLLNVIKQLPKIKF